MLKKIRIVIILFFMQCFSKKNGWIFVGALLLAFALSSLAVVFSAQIADWLPGFLETNVFHRTFDHDSYRSSIISLITYPSFIVVLVAALLFVKFPERQREVLLAGATFIVFLLIFFVVYLHCGQNIDEDDASEFLLAKECFLEKTLWPLGWYYSSEFRLFYSQVAAAPCFLFTSNLVLIKTMTVIIMLAVLYASQWFLLSALRVKKLWIKLLVGLLIVSPASHGFWRLLHFGSFYVVHVVYQFLYLGLFISIVYHGLPKRKLTAFGILFILLSFFSGLSTIRYIINFTFPMAALLVGKKVFADFRQKKPFVFSEWKKDREIFWSVSGLFVSGIGYILNSTVLASLYSFKNYNKIRFLDYGEISFDSILHMILSMLGYNYQTSVFTPGGVATVLIAVVVIFTVILFVSLLKTPQKDYERTFLHFVLFAFVFGFYTNVNIEMVGYYFVTSFIFFLPFLALVLQNGEVSALHQWILSASAALMILANSFVQYADFSAKNENGKKDGAIAYLLDNGYSFGYSFFKEANETWFYTNGRIEVGDLVHDDNDENNTDVLPENFKVHKWLTPKRYYESGFKENEPVFLFLRREDYLNTPEHKVFLRGNLSYEDENYVVFTYESNGAFRKAFD